MTLLTAAIYITMTLVCIMAITLTISEIQSIWLKYKRNKGDK